MNISFLFQGVQVIGLNTDNNKRTLYIQSKDKSFWIYAGNTRESLTEAYNKEYRI